MGYTTDFMGEFELDKPLLPEHDAYLHAFNRTRRMQRNAALTAERPDPVREAVELPVGPEGAYFVGADLEHFGQERSEDIIDYNRPPQGQPGLWCQWAPTHDSAGITWDGGEKFYSYVEWLEYLVEHFLKPWGYVLSGEVEWQGEEPGDCGLMVVTANRVGVREGQRTFGEVEYR